MLKKSTGLKSQRRFNTELKYAQIFNYISPKIISANEETLEIIYREINQEREWVNKDLYEIGQILAEIHLENMKIVIFWPERLFLRFNERPEYQGLLQLYQFRDLIKEVKTGTIHGDFRLRNILKDDKEIKITD